MSYANIKSPLFHPLGLASPRLWRRVRHAYGDVAPAYRMKAALIALNSRLTTPLRMLEQLRFGKAVEAQQLGEPPVFIIGHWRTGTTFLHNLLCQDPQFGYVTTYQTIAPDSCLAGRSTLKPILQSMMPATRPMDNVEISADGPQEEEYALCNMTPHSFYAGFYFPQRMAEVFERYVLFDGLSDDDMAEWQAAYQAVLKKAAYLCGGKRLVLKNPANTGRVPVLRTMFPGAKFIHIHRDPYVVFKSTMRLYRSVFPTVGLQTISDAELEQFVLDAYRSMMARYLELRETIPASDLVEVAYDDLVSQPLAEVQRIYDELALPGWERAALPIERHINAQTSYRKNAFEISVGDIAKVEAHWDFALRHWNYRRPQSAAV